MRTGYQPHACGQLVRHICFEDRSRSMFVLFVAAKNIYRATEPVLLRNTLVSKACARARTHTHTSLAAMVGLA